jgi:5-formyltetrahydrofolate cyclo-ligase
MLGFNERGFRLGRGGGFYDKLLSNEDILKIGISESIGLVDFQEEKHDVRMDYIVTEQGILNFIQ